MNVMRLFAEPTVCKLPITHSVTGSQDGGIGLTSLLSLPTAFGEIYMGQTFNCYVNLANNGQFLKLVQRQAHQQHKQPQHDQQQQAQQPAPEGQQMAQQTQGSGSSAAGATDQREGAKDGEGDVEIVSVHAELSFSVLRSVGIGCFLSLSPSHTQSSFCSSRLLSLDTLWTLS